MSDHNNKFKLILLGDSQVGKTSLISRLVYNTFTPEVQPTIGADFLAKTILTDSGKAMLKIFDVAGQERFRSLLPTYCEAANLLVLVYSCQTKDSFDHLSSFLELFKGRNEGNSVTAVCANFCGESGRVVSKEEGEGYANSIGARYFETNAASGEGIKELFDWVSGELVARIGMEIRNEGIKAEEKAPENAKEEIKEEIKEKDKLKFKIAVIGESGSGKTSILQRYIYDYYSAIFHSTVGVDFTNKTIKNKSSSLSLQLWDTSGQLRFISLIPSYIRDSKAVLVVYSCADRATFTNIQGFVDLCRANSDSATILIIVGNQCDADNREVSAEEGKEFAKSVGAVYFETSAKTGEGVEELFSSIVSRLTPKEPETSAVEHQQETPIPKAVRAKDEYDHLLKLLLIGDSGSGKSSILQRYSDDVFTEQFIATVGVDFKVKTITDKSNIIKLQIWDTSGQERFKTITSSYYKVAHGIILTYRCDSSDTFENLGNWVEECNRFAQNNVKIAVCAACCDVKNRLVTEQEGREFASRLGASYYETSALRNIGIEKMFSEFSCGIIGDIKSTPEVKESKIEVKAQDMPNPAAKDSIGIMGMFSNISHRIAQGFEHLKRIEEIKSEPKSVPADTSLTLPKRQEEATPKPAPVPVKSHSNDYDHLLKLLLIGDTETGKSSILQRYADNVFTESFISTIGVDFKIRTITEDSTIIKLQIWDTAGQERFKTITSSYYRVAHGIIIVYRCNSRETFQYLRNWVQECNRFAKEGVNIAICANFCDADNRIVTEQEGREFAAGVGAMYYETSARMGTGIEEMFSTFSRKIVRKIENPQEIETQKIESKAVIPDKAPTSEADSNPESNNATVLQPKVQEQETPKPSVPAKDYDYLLKFLLIGDSGTGKSCILLRYADDVFKEEYIATIGVDFKIKSITENSKDIKLQIWDTAGQERFRTVISTYYKGAHGIIITYDCNIRDNFEKLNSWVQECKKYAQEHVKLAICANFCDSNDRRVSEAEGREFARNIGALYFETSAKRNTGINELFSGLAMEIISEKENPKKISVESKTSEQLRENPPVLTESLSKPETSHNAPNDNLKLVIVGPSNVGKSAILRRIRNDPFDPSFSSTIGADSFTKPFSLDSHTYTLHILDTAGQERFQSVVSAYYPGAHAIIIVYNCTDRLTFENLQGYVDKARETGDSNRSIAVVANYCNEGQREVTTEEGKIFSQKNGAVYYETSAKTGDGIEGLLLGVVTKITRNSQALLGVASTDSAQEIAKSSRKGSNSYDCLYKILIVGDTETGKTSMLCRYADHLFQEAFTTTIGMDFKIKTVVLESKTIKLQIWDTAGQERFRTITSSFYNGFNGIILTYRCDRRESFDNLEAWVKECRRYGSEQFNIVISANFADVYERTVTQEEGQNFANKVGARYYETSAKNNTGIEEVFSALTSMITNNSSPAVEEAKQPISASENVTATGNEPLLFKLVVTGDSRVGKSSLILRYASDMFVESYYPTYGVDFKSKKIYSGEQGITMQIWDTAGQERFGEVVESYYRGADAVIIMFSCEDRQSFSNLDKWIAAVRAGSGQKLLILVGNWCESLERRVTTSEAQSLADKEGMIYFEVDTKSNKGIEALFSEILHRVSEDKINSIQN